MLYDRNRILTVSQAMHAKTIRLYRPLNRGSSFQTEMGPREENCPRASSRKKSGRPARTSMMMYGIRKLASKQTKQIRPLMPTFDYRTQYIC